MACEGFDELDLFRDDCLAYRRCHGGVDGKDGEYREVGFRQGDQLGAELDGLAILGERLEVERRELIALGAGADLQFDDRHERGVPGQGAELTAAGDAFFQDFADQTGLDVAAALHADFHLAQEGVGDDGKLLFEGFVEVVGRLAEVRDAFTGVGHARHQRFVEAVAEADGGGRDTGAGGLGDLGEDFAFVDHALVGLTVAEEDDTRDTVLAGEGGELFHAFFPAAEQIRRATGIDSVDAQGEGFAVGDRDQRLHDFDVIIERDDGNAVIVAEAADDANGAFESRGDRAAGHRARAVNDQGEVEGGARSLGDVRGFDRGDEADEDMRRISGGAEEALLEGQDFDLGLVHGRSHRHHSVPPFQECQHR